jgi:two-component system cell cycle response regulator
MTEFENIGDTMKILIAEDDLLSRKMLESILSKLGYEVLAVDSGSKAWDILSSESSPQIAILDWMMPGMDGPEVCSKIRQRESGIDQYTYIILLTAKTEKKDLIAGMESGADDYISKPFDTHELGVRVRAGQRVIELQNQLRNEKEKHLILSMTDGLTGILNRRALYEALEREILRAGRERTPLSIIMLDIDFFKKINDGHGHNTGDVVLKELVRRILAELRPYDTFGRYGGEEFIVLLPGAYMYEVLAVSERIRGAIRNTPFDVGTACLPVTASFGVAEFDFKENSDALIKRADVALYKAKKNGRDRIEN